MEKTTDSIQNNKTISRQFFEQFEKANISQIQSLWSNNYKLHFPGKTSPLNIEESKQLLKSYNTAFPDLKITNEYQVAEGDYVVNRLSFRGTHKGEFQGIPATNKKITVTGTAVHRIVNNKIEEEWAEFDALGLMQQLGVVTTEVEHARHQLLIIYKKQSPENIFSGLCFFISFP